MATLFEATLRLLGSDETAQAFQSAAENAKRFQKTQQETSRGVKTDIDALGRAFRFMIPAAAGIGTAAFFKNAMGQALDFNQQLNKIGINAGASQETMQKVGQALRDEALRINLDLNQIVAGFEAWRVASNQTVEEALKNYPQVASMAKAMGADVATVATMAGRLRGNLKLDDAGVTRAFDMIAKGAVNLSVPFEQVAPVFTDFSEKLEKLGVTGPDAVNQIVSTFTTLQKSTGNTSEALRVMTDLGEKISSPDFLSGQYINGFMGEVKRRGEPALKVLADIMQQGILTEEMWGQAQGRLTKDYGPEAYKMVSMLRQGTLSLANEWNNVADSTGAYTKRVKEASQTPNPWTYLANVFKDMMLSIGNIIVELDKAFGSGNRTALQQFGDLLRDLAGEMKKIADFAKAAKGYIDELVKFANAPITTLAEKVLGKEAAQTVAGAAEQYQKGIETRREEFAQKAEEYNKATGREDSEWVKSWFRRPASPAAVATAEQSPAPAAAAAAVARQAGGPVEAGQPYTIGERGPELFVPNVDGRIVPDWRPPSRAAAIRPQQLGAREREEQATLDTESVESTDKNTSAITTATREQQRLNELLGELNQYMAEQLRQIEPYVPPAAMEQPQIPTTGAAGAVSFPKLGGAAPGAGGLGVARVGVAPTRAVTTELSPEARALLDTIAGTESGGIDPYTQMYGGRNVQLAPGAAAPGVPIRSGPNVGKTSSAYGRYQFINPTWFEQQRKIVGQRPELAEEFAQRTPKAQDIAAWNKARERYEGATGGDLQAAIESGQLEPRGMRALAAEWTSLPGGIEQQRRANPFQQRLAANLAAQREQTARVQAPATAPATAQLRLEPAAMAEGAAGAAAAPSAPQVAPETPAEGFAEAALERARAARAEMAEPIDIPVNFVVQPGQTNMMERSMRQRSDRVMREAVWNSYADVE